MKLLVTGGAGFIGSSVVDALIEKGHDVVVVDDLSTGEKKNINPKAKFYKLDIGDEKKIEKVFKAEKPQAVFHLAAQIDVRKSVADPVGDAHKNIIAGLTLLESCRKHQVAKVIFSSTGGAIYGDTESRPTAENHPESPVSPYGIAKLTLEKYLYFYHYAYGLSYVVLRYANVYGPRQNARGEAGVVAIFCDRLLAGQPPVINGDGRQTRDYVYVSDVVEANVLALAADKVGIYNVGTGVETSVNDLALHLKNIFRFDKDFNYGPPKTGEQQHSAIDFSKISKDFGWKPKVALIEGLMSTVNWFRAASK
ncbi:MAG: NAD-dependent epimerase/dehydratase family protein [Candidatus Buchananbacteria bacterium]|nr:NAD-dependent epimerase/dehydratase family protein [Candidatus Buchananbacteria bacterium]